MISTSEQREAQHRPVRMMRDAGIQIMDDEIETIEVVDFGLGLISTRIYESGGRVRDPCPTGSVHRL